MPSSVIQGMGPVRQWGRNGTPILFFWEAIMPEKKSVTPLQISGLSDMHCHCDFSIDALGTIEEYCDAALERGLAEICFTTHYDANPRSEDGKASFISVGGKRKPATIDNLVPYVEHV